jgi:hypothetical protein
MSRTRSFLVFVIHKIIFRLEMEKYLYSIDIVCSGRPPAHNIVSCLSFAIVQSFSTTDSLSTKRYEAISLVGQNTVANWPSIEFLWLFVQILSFLEKINLQTKEKNKRNPSRSEIASLRSNSGFSSAPRIAKAITQGDLRMAVVRQLPAQT